jgi:hypothetical protein
MDDGRSRTLTVWIGFVWLMIMSSYGPMCCSDEVSSPINEGGVVG